MRDHSDAGRRRFLRERRVRRELAGGAEGVGVVGSAVAVRRRDRSMLRQIGTRRSAEQFFGFAPDHSVRQSRGDSAMD
jgi:hypothetical protein